MGSTLASRALGRLLEKYRKRANVSKNAMAKAAETSPQTYGRLEDGLKHNVPDMVINALCDRLAVSNDERRLLLTLAAEARKERKSGGKWWRAYIEDMQVDFDHFLNLEQSARRATTVQIGLMPGLLQTTEYRRQLAWAGHPFWTPEEVERRLALATIRQERLSDPDFEFEAILAEGLIRQQTGGLAVISEQLHHILAVSEQPNVSVRVVPVTATNPIASVVDLCVLFEFGPLPSTKLIEPPVVFVEEFTGALYLETEDHIDPYKDAIARARQVALNTDASRDFIRAVAREYSE